MFLQRGLRADGGRLLRTWKAGSAAKHNGYLEDYGCLAEGLLSLYEATFDDRWFRWATELARFMLDHFKDPDRAGFYDTSDDHEQLIHRPRDMQDNAMPSGNAKGAMVLFRLGLYTGDSEFFQVAEDAAAIMVEPMRRYPGGFGEWLNVASFMLGQPRELALLGPMEMLAPMRAVVNETYRPGLVVAASEAEIPANIPLLAGRAMRAGLPTAYLCQRFTCQAPLTDPGELRKMLAAR